MAKKVTSDELTIDWRTIMSMPPSTRQQLLYTGNVDPLLGVLTPGQRVALFPDYFKKELSSLAGQKGEFGGPSGAGPSLTAPRTGPVTIPASSIPAGTKKKIENAPGPQVLSPGYKAGKPGTYRPVYGLTDDDLSDAVINTIAGEALNNQDSIDGVINNMLNRVGVQKNWNNLRQVARDPGQYAGYRKASPEQAEFIRQRIREIASGSVPSNIGTATEFRAKYYVDGAGYGKTFERKARAQGYLQPGGKDDNVYATTFPPGPYAPYSEDKVTENLKAQGIENPDDAKNPPVAQVLDDSLPIGDQTATPIPEQVASAGGIVPSITYSLTDGAMDIIRMADKSIKTKEDALNYIRKGKLEGVSLNEKNQIIIENPEKANRLIQQKSTFINPLTGKPIREPYQLSDIVTQNAPPEPAPTQTQSSTTSSNGQPAPTQTQSSITSGNGQPALTAPAPPGFVPDTYEVTPPTKPPTAPDVGSQSTAPQTNETATPIQEPSTLVTDLAVLAAGSGLGFAGTVGSLLHWRDTDTSKPGNSGFGNWVNENIPGAKWLDNKAYDATGGWMGTSKDDPRDPNNKPKSSMAAGGFLREPHTAVNNRTGEVVNLGEVGTGGEAIVPMSKVNANEVGQQPYQMPAMTNNIQEVSQNAQKNIQQEQIIQRTETVTNATGQATPSNVQIAVDHQVIPPTARKAYADATLTPRINNFSSTGAQYRSFGI